MGIEVPVEQHAQLVHDVDVPPFVVAADVVALADASLLDDQRQRTAVIEHEQPVAHIAALSVDRQRFAIQRVDQHQRDEFLGELEGSVVVRAVTGGDGHPVGVVVGADQVVGRGLARRIG